MSICTTPAVVVVVVCLSLQVRNYHPPLRKFSARVISVLACSIVLGV